ncbi:MAG: acetolactate synthase small subunit [Planctomycetota bacterium]
MNHTISCRVKDRPGVLAHIANSFSEKGINILSLAVAVTEGYDDTRMTIVVPGETVAVEEVFAHLKGLGDVLEVQDLAGGDFVQRELVLIKVAAAPENIPRIMQILELFDAPVADIGRETLTVEFAGPGNKVTALIKLLAPFGIRAVTRTGMVALRTGDAV